MKISCFGEYLSTQFCQDQIRDDKAKMAKAVRKNVTIPKSRFEPTLTLSIR